MFSIKELRNHFLDYLNNNTFTKEPKGLYEPVDYIMSLGGKRMRPVSLLMACQLFSNDLSKALPAAFAVELFHNFSLVHDDIMDEAPLRRGKDTVHKKYDVNTAILSGDAMLVKTYMFLAKSADNNLSEILSIYNETAIGVCEGQQLDMDFETMDNVEESLYLKMIELKTAVLLAGGLKIGALIGGANNEDAQHLYEFGRHLGIAFQLQDDLLDSFGDPEKFGKKVGGDIAQNKKTYLVINALKAGSSEDQIALRQLMTSDNSISEDEKIRQVKQIFQKLNIPQLTQSAIEWHHEKALKHLDAVSVSSDKKTNLMSLAGQLLVRES